jgi:hypothetical protein
MLEAGGTVRRIAIALTGLTMAACAGPPAKKPAQVTGMKMTKIEDVLNRNTDSLMAVGGVEGVGIGGSASAPVIVVMVRGNQSEMARKLPKQVEGYTVKVEVTGQIRAQ